MSEDAIRAACDAKDLSAAITEALRAYGSELHGYLIAVTRDDVVASEVFSMAVEDLWKGLSTFRWDCTFRTWSYTVTRHALLRYRRDPFRRRAVAEDALLGDLVAEARSRTQTFLRTETKDKLAEVRASLDPDDQTLLILRINRGLAWREIARVMATDEDPAPDVDRYAATLRKRFDRLKDELRKRMRGDVPT